MSRRFCTLLLTLLLGLAVSACNWAEMKEIKEPLKLYNVEDEEKPILVGIETLDRGIVHEDGSVSLQGRLEGAPARGCSLTVEEAWATDGRA